MHLTLKNKFLFYFFITSLSCLLIFFSLLFIYQSKPATLAKEIIMSFFGPHYNNCVLSSVEGMPVSFYIYCVILISFLTIGLLKAPMRKPSFFGNYADVLKNVTWSTICVVVILQTVNQTLYMNNEYKTAVTKPVDERYPDVNWLPTIQFCGTSFKEILEEKRSAKFITDINISKDPGMAMFFAMAYYLYPIDIRNIRNEPEDTLIVFLKENPHQSIPDDYIVLKNIVNAYFLAVKKGTVDDQLLAR